MASEWRKSTIGEEANILLGYAFKSTGFVDHGLGVRLLRGDNVKRGVIEWGEKSRYWPTGDSGLERYQLRAGDIVVGMDGSRVGENFACVSDADLPALLVQRVACLRTKGSVLQPYLRYLVCNPSFTSYVKSVHTGTSIPHISGKQIASFEVVVPPPHVQEELSSLLSVLDDRIDSLRAVNITFESIAQALFQSWFVDFDPVHAKAEGREPEGMDAATAALFPSEFEDSELGPVPKGWRVQSLVDAFELNPRRTLKKGGLSMYLDMASVPKSGHVPAPPVERVFSSGSKFINGDTLLARITPCLENGKTAHVDFLDKDETAWGSTEFIVLRPRSPLPPYFGYLLARQTAFRTFAIQAMSGTSGRQRVQLGRLEQFQMAFPDDAIAARFGDIVEPLRESISANAKRAETFASLRDTLLPCLISGKRRLPEVEAATEEAMA